MSRLQKNAINFRYLDRKARGEKGTKEAPVKNVVAKKEGRKKAAPGEGTIMTLVE